MTKTFNPIQNQGFLGIKKKVDLQFINYSHEVYPTTWQGVDVSAKKEAKMHELINTQLMFNLEGLDNLDWVKDLEPNMPWAEDHFRERVGGYPINPGVEWANWPWGDNAKKFLDETGQFNHNYMERYWPTYANREYLPTRDTREWNLQVKEKPMKPNRGINGLRIEGLDGVINLLMSQPDTRQAYLPVWFPEDTGIGDGGRKPCSLGYLFMVRDNRLHIQYFIRSCDYFRHMADDIYLTVRLGQWILEVCRHSDKEFEWGKVELGSLVMVIGSLHVFVNDMIQIRRRNGV